MLNPLPSDDELLENDIFDNLQVEKNNDFCELLTAEENSIVISEQINNDTDADIALEAISNYLNSSLKDGYHSEQTLTMANVAIESIYNKVNLKNEKITFSLEDYKKDPKESIRLALEDIKEKAASLWDSVKQKITLLAKFLGDKMNYFKRNLSNMKADVYRLEKIVNELNSKAEARYKILKPQNWFLDLMYSQKGMPIGLEGIGKAVEQLLNEHSKMSTTSVNKYTQWLIANHKKAETDSSVFSSLKVNTDEFLLSGAKEFDRSINLKRPTGENMFYRGKELPGNKAFFTQVRPKDKSGIAAIGTIADVGFGIHDYDPQSYKLDRMKIVKIMSAGTIPWVLGVAAVTTSLATAGALGIVYGATLGSMINKAKVENTGRAIHIDSNMIFNTLTIPEIKKTILDLKSGIKTLEKWYVSVFENNWKQTELDKIINNITGLDRVSVNNNSSFRALKRYCMALLNLMNSTTVSTHIYAFKTYNAMINYIDKSAQQYK